MLKLSISSGAAGGVLAYTHGGVGLIKLTHFSLLAVVFHARICEETEAENHSEMSGFICKTTE